MCVWGLRVASVSTSVAIARGQRNRCVRRGERHAFDGKYIAEKFEHQEMKRKKSRWKEIRDGERGEMEEEKEYGGKKVLTRRRRREGKEEERNIG